MIEREIDKSALMDVIEYELDWRDQAHKAEIEEVKKELEKELKKELEKEISAKNQEIKAKDQENARLKAKLEENGISY